VCSAAKGPEAEQSICPVAEGMPLAPPPTSRGCSRGFSSPRTWRDRIPGVATLARWLRGAIAETGSRVFARRIERLRGIGKPGSIPIVAQNRDEVVGWEELTNEPERVCRHRDAARRWPANRALRGHSTPASSAPRMFAVAMPDQIVDREAESRGGKPIAQANKQPVHMRGVFHAPERSPPVRCARRRRAGAVRDLEPRAPSGDLLPRRRTERQRAT